MLKTERQILFDFAKVQLLDSSIARIEIFTSEKAIRREEAKLMNEAIGELSHGKEVPVLIFAHDAAQIDHTAREYSASKEGFRFTKKEALLIDNLAHKIIADFYLRINKPVKPCRVFSKEEDAINWLLSD